MTSVSLELLTINLRPSVGMAANSTGAAPATWKFKSGTSGLHDKRAVAEGGEKYRQLPPHGGSSSQSPPFGPDQAHQFEAFVDGQKKMFMGGGDAVDEQAFDVRLHRI